MFLHQALIVPNFPYDYNAILRAKPGKTPVEVAITLNLRQPQITEFYKEY